MPFEGSGAGQGQRRYAAASTMLWENVSGIAPGGAGTAQLQTVGYCNLRLTVEQLAGTAGGTATITLTPANDTGGTITLPPLAIAALNVPVTVQFPTIVVRAASVALTGGGGAPVGEIQTFNVLLCACA